MRAEKQTAVRLPAVVIPAGRKKHSGGINPINRTKGELRWNIKGQKRKKGLGG